MYKFGHFENPYYKNKHLCMSSLNTDYFIHIYLDFKIRKY